MLQRRSGGLTVILEQQDVLKPAVLLKIENAVAKCPQHVFNPLRGQGCETGVVVGSFDNDFMRPNAVHPVKHSLSLAVQRAFNAQSGKLVRHHTHRPPWCIPLGGWSSIRSWAVGLNFRRCLTFVAIAKGANPPFNFTFSRAKSVGRLARSVEIITQRPTIGSFLNSGTQEPLYQNSRKFYSRPSARNYETAQSAAGWLANGHSIR